MKQITISEEEARVILEELRKSWITLENQHIVFKLLTRLENELSS